MSTSDRFGCIRCCCRLFWYRCCCWCGWRYWFSARTKFILMPNNMSTTIGIMFFFPLICSLVAATVTNRNTKTIDVDAVVIVVVSANLHNFICWYYLWFFYYEISSFMKNWICLLVYFFFSLDFILLVCSHVFEVEDLQKKKMCLRSLSRRGFGPRCSAQLFHSLLFGFDTISCAGAAVEISSLVHSFPLWTIQFNNLLITNEIITLFALSQIFIYFFFTFPWFTSFFSLSSFNTILFYCKRQKYSNDFLVLSAI